jgi:hydrogenase expression/formation protein HypE
MSVKPDAAFSCPIPINEYPNVLLAHGGGGKLMHDLIERMFVPSFSNPSLETRHDGAVFKISDAKLAFTTDSYVVKPIFFPGGNIGTLAINGTVNDLAMCGARPLYLSCGFILEEGLSMESLWQIVRSMRECADAIGVQLVTGDTKVVDRGKGDGIFVNTAGVGIVERDVVVAPSRVAPGDVILLNGDIGRHGIALMAVREGLEFDSRIESDCAPLAGLVMDLLEAGIDVHCMRDLTRGGLASALVEISESAGARINIDEPAIPVREDVAGACEILGFDPLYLANEGRFVTILSAGDADRALSIMRKHALGRDAVAIGGILSAGAPLVTMTSRIGASRIVEMFTGEQLPRIC